MGAFLIAPRAHGSGSPQVFEIGPLAFFIRSKISLKLFLR